MYYFAMNSVPVVLVHGLGSSFEHNWRESGWVDLLESEGRTVVGFELPGHGAQPAPAAGSESPVDRMASLLADIGPADVVGFSAGAALSLATLVRHPDSFRRVALLGIGDTMLAPSPGVHDALADRLEAPAAPDDGAMVQLLRQMAAKAGNDLAGVAAYARSMLGLGDPDAWGSVHVPALVVLGDEDPVGPADRIVAGLPEARLLVLSRTDHFATTSSFTCLDAVLRFLS